MSLFRKEARQMEGIRLVEEGAEGEKGEEKGEEFSVSEVRGVPVILCPEDLGPMEIGGTERREVEERKFFFMTSTEEHLHLQYECPECGRYYFHDLEMRRQGCFIATAAYGTALSEEIDSIRRVRDSYLVNRKWGRKLISTYYTLSPPLARIIERSEPLKKLVRTFLTPLVKLFREEA